MLALPSLTYRDSNVPLIKFTDGSFEGLSYKFENISIPNDTNYIEYLDKSPSFHSYDYSWTKDYDTIYNGLYTFDENKITNKMSSEYNTIPPFWCKYNYNQFEQLTYYCVDTSNIPVTYDSLFRNYVVL